MEKKATKKIKKKVETAIVSEGDLVNNIPSAPTLDDFITGDNATIEAHQNDTTECAAIVEKPKEETKSFPLPESFSENKKEVPFKTNKETEICPDCNTRNKIKQKPNISLYPDLTKIKTRIVSQISVKVEHTENAIEEMSIYEFHENSLKNPIGRHVCRVVHDFLNNENNLLEDDWFYSAVQQYLKSRIELSSIKGRISELNINIDKLRSNVWVIDNCTAAQSRICKDNIHVTAKHEYKMATLSQSSLQDLERNCKELRENCHKNFVHHSHICSLLKIKIEHYTNKLCSSTQKTEDQKLRLKICISILFRFIRKEQTEKQFIMDVRAWLNILIREFLVGDDSDKEMFLLNQILRCPPGISWAVQYFQCPEPTRTNAFLPNSNVELYLVFLYTILGPVEKREQFLKKADINLGSVSEAIASWILVDSDGEDDSVTVIRPLKESDIISLINQIPFESFFSSILISNKQKEPADSETAYQEFKRFIQFCTTFVYILSRGLKTYNSNRYSTLTMLLGRLIKHSLDYVTEELKIYLSRTNNKSVSAEYDAFCIRVVHSIIWSNNTCKWQLLTTVCWEHITTRALWCIFDHVFHNIEERDWALHKLQIHEYETKYRQEDEQLFLDKVMKLPQNELYFLLHTFSNMTMKRSSEDFNFVIKITDMILKIGFHEANSSNSKWARTYAASICEKYPDIISYVISIVKNKISPSMALYLFKEIKLKSWTPQPYDINIVSNWLLDSDEELSENELARHILSNLNYGIDHTSGQLYLEPRIHYEIGLAVARSCLVHDKRSSIKNKSYVAESIKHVTNLVWSSTSDTYHKWSLEMLRKLRIHCLSQTDNVSKACCLPAKEPLRNIYDVERISEIMEGVTNNHPVACYFAVLATTSGHSVPVIYSKGLNHLKVLDQCKEHEAVVHIIHLIVPLFLECQEELIENPVFTELLNSLVKLPMSRQIFGGEAGVSGIANSFNNMIMHQIMSYQRYSLSNPSSLIIFWLKCILKLDWNNSSVTYILNNLSQMVYVFPNSWSSADEILKTMLTNTSNESKSFFSWVYPTNNIMSYSNFKAPWLEKLILQMKHHLTERKTGLWQEIIEQIHVYEGKLNLEKAIQKAAVVTNTTIIPKQLCVYHWAEFGLAIPVEHPITPLVWHQFFSMLLERVHMSNGRTCCFGLNFLHDGQVNVKNLSEYFEKTQKYFLTSVASMQSECTADQFDQAIRNKMELHHNLSSIYGLFKIWLSDARVFDANFEISNLAKHYEPAILHAFTSNNYEIMIPFLDTYNMHISIMDMVNNFESSFLKSEKISLSSSRTFTNLTPQEKIEAKLSSYEIPIKLSSCDCDDKIQFEIQESVIDNLSTTKKYLQKYIHQLSQYARTHEKKFLEHTSLDYTLLDLYPVLYQNVPFKKTTMASCTSQSLYDKLMWREPKPCTGPVEVILEYTDLQLNESVNRKIQRNINDTDNLIATAIVDLPMDLCLATAIIQEIIRLICAKKSGIGKEMFYFILDLHYKEKNYFPPLDDLYSACLNELAKAFYYNDEDSISELLRKIESNISFLPLLSNFLPVDYMTPAGFVKIYSHICGYSLSFENQIILLEKFDVAKWLSISKNNHVYILELLYVIENAILSPSVFEFDENLFEVHKILIQHMMSIYHFNYPNYYWNVLELILKGLSNLNITPYCLECFINAYCDKPILQFSKTNTYNKDYWRQLKPNRTVATRRILTETCIYLSKYFLSERLQIGVHGLYSKYKKYFTVIQVLLGTLTVCSAYCTKEMIKESIKIDGKQSVYQIFSIWSPWLLPLWPSRLEEKPPDWILQLTLDGPLLPWSSRDLTEVNKMISNYIDCASVFDEYVPECEVLRYLLDTYIVEFCNTKIPSHVIKMMNTGLLDVRWTNYHINNIDIVNMHRIMMQFLPDCHYLIAYVFVQLKWKEFLLPFRNTCDKTENVNILSYFVELLVHIAYEPSQRNKQSMLHLIENDLLDFNWSVIEYTAVNSLLNWFVMSANPISLLSKKAEYDTDRTVLKMIETTVGFNADHKDFPKIFTFVRANVRILEIIAKRNLATCNAEKIEFQKVLDDLLTITQSVVNNNDNTDIALLQGSELFKEICVLLNFSDSRYNYAEIAHKAVTDCINKGMQKNCVYAMLTILSSITNESINAAVMELLIGSYFKTVDDSSLKHWHFLLKEIGPVFIPSLKVLAAGPHIKSLHIKYLRMISESHNKEKLLENVQSMLDNLHHINVSLEEEFLLPLLWFDVLNTLNEVLSYEKDVLRYLNGFCSYLEKLADTSAGILGVIKLKKNTHSDGFRIMCRIMQVFLLSQMYIIENEVVLKTDNSSKMQFHQNIPEYDIAKQKLSRKTSNIEKLLIERGLKYIEDRNDLTTSTSVLKSLLSIAYEQSNLYDCL